MKKFKPWQWIAIGVMGFVSIGTVIGMGLWLIQTETKANRQLATSVAATARKLNKTATPLPTATRTPRPTNTRVVQLTPLQTPVLPTPGPKDYFPLAVGYRWVYQNELDEQVVRIVEDKIVENGQVYYLVSEQVGDTDSVNGYKGQYLYQLQTNAILLENYTMTFGRVKGYVYGPLLPIIKKPFDSSPWSWGGQRFEENASPVSLQITWKASPEKVSLPAGDFECYRVTATGQGTTVSWYAPGVGLVKQSIKDSAGASFKLVEYWLGQDKP